MKSKEEILQILKSKMEYLKLKYSVTELALFGSYSRGANTPDSDVDLLVKTAHALGFDFVNLAFELEALLQTKVDLRTKNSIKPEYFKEIEKDMIYV